jgi:sigma-B regulation protein RsbU (phosphoserine phosphatase)
MSSSAPARRWGSVRSRAARTRRWVNAWLIAAALLALLLLANSVRDYFRVWRILAIQQVRHQASQYVVELEQRLRRSATPALVSGEVLTPESGQGLDDARWVEVRSADGVVLARRGDGGGRTFTAEEQSTAFRAHLPLFSVVPSAAGDVVVEVLPLRGTGLGGPVGTTPLPAGSTPGRGPRSVLAVEIASPLVIRDPSVLRPIRQDLAISCTGALALLTTVLIAAAGFRSYERGRRMEAQLEIAREVQTALLPSRTDEFEPVRLAAAYRPAEEVSGDFYDVFRAPGGRIALVVGDVSGKGVPAALVTGVIHGAVRSAAWTESCTHHERESERLNRLLCEGTAGGRYASMFWGYYDTSTSTLHYVNAGHLLPMLLGGGNRATDIAELDAGGPVLGILSDARYQQGCREIRPGDTLVLYSDGLVEATSPTGEEYGEARLRELLKARCDASPEGIKEAILASVGEFLAAATLRDDLTLLVARFGERL